MAAAAPQADPMKARIISHMNADHASSLALYLRHYCHLTTRQAVSAKMTDITTTYIIIESTFGRYLIPLNPPMKSMAESRERLVSMNRDSLRGLGLSDIVVTEWRRPRGFHLFMFILCTWIFISFSRQANFNPSRASPVYMFWSLNNNFPPLAAFCKAVRPYLLTLIIAIHAGEAYWLAKSRLEKHQVSLFSKVWWLWITDHCIEGFGCFQRFDQIVKEKEGLKKKADQRH